MPLWGIKPEIDESRPKWLTPFEARDVTAQKEGWVQFNNNSAKREVLVAIGELEDTLGAPSVADVRVVQNGRYADDVVEVNAAAITAGVYIDVIFNEPVLVTVNRNAILLSLTRTAGTGTTNLITVGLVAADVFSHENVLRFQLGTSVRQTNSIGNSYHATTLARSTGRIKYSVDNTAQDQDAVLTIRANNRGPSPLIKIV